MGRIIDLNEIGYIIDFQFTDNVYLGCETLGLSLDCHSEMDFAESNQAIGTTACVEIDGVGSYLGEVASILYDDRSCRLDVLLKLMLPEEEWE